MLSARAPAAPVGPSIRVHERAPFELDTEAVMGEHLRKDPQGTSLLKSRAKRTSLPMDQTDEDKTPGVPSPLHMLGIRPTSEASRACGVCPAYPIKSYRGARRRCHWADHLPLRSGLGYKAQGLVDEDGALTPPARSAAPTTSTDRTY